MVVSNTDIPCWPAQRAARYGGEPVTTDSDRISRLEGAYEHLATKADLHQMENRLIRWLLAGIAAAVGVATGLDRLLGG